MSDSRGETLRVAGATLFYRVRGAGPLLLILAGGENDADMTDALCDQLADRYTVVTYDRRGLSRSTIDESARDLSIETHSDDAHRLLAALTSEPASVFGNSIGGFSGLDLVARHPDQVRVIIAHESPTGELLPDTERERLVRAQQDMADTFKREGVAAAMKKSAALAALDLNDREPDVALPPMTPQREKNLTFLLSHDVPAVRRYRVDLGALRAASARIVPAAGRATGGSLLHHCAAALAQRLDRPLVEFPGGHTGWLLRPEEFAASLSQVLG